MTCPACATPTVPGARFCFACGLELPESVATGVGTERRVVTVLFGDLSDFTSWSEDLDPERVGVVTSRVLATLAGAVGEFGGHVDKLTGDGLMAVFGAPTTHEDDAERAVRAAARMQTAVRRVVEEESGGGRRLGLRVGLNTGEVVAGVQAHLSYTVVGDTVNTAARLSDAAGVGAVLAGRETALATMGAASWRTLPPLRLKGKREPVTAYELVALRSTSASRLGLGDEAHLIGRDEEMGRLVSLLLETVDRREPRTVLLTGEAGVGKTRLAQELSRFHGELPDARVLWGRCAPYGEGRELSAVADMVRTACGIDEQDGVERSRERVARTVARLSLADPVSASPGTEERLRTLLGLEDLPGGPESGAPGVGGGGDGVRSAVGALFTALAARGPLLLVLDDLHWASPTMLDGVLDVARQTRGQVLLLALGRPDSLDARPGESDDPWWQGLPDVELLPVPPLEDRATDRLLRAYLGAPDDDLDPAVRAALLSRAQGNPFFLGELLHLLVDRGALVREGDRWVLRGLPPEGVLPAGVQAVLSARIDRLDGAAKGVLRDASVLGLRASVPGLVAVGRASGHGVEAVVRAAVAELVDRRLLEAAGPSVEDGDTYRFTHTLVRDVAYAGLAKAERARRHAAAAWHAAGLPPRTVVESGSEAVEPSRAPDVDSAVASQAERAVLLAAEMGLPRSDPSWAVRELAFAALARLGSAALVADDLAPAEDTLRRALAVRSAGRLTLPTGTATPDPVVVAVEVRHAQALSRLHRLDEAESELAGGLVCAVPRLRAAALMVLGEVRRQRGQTAAARSALVQALKAAGDADDDRLTAEALRELGLLDHVAGRLREAEARFRSAHELAAQVGDLRGAGWALQHLAWTATTRGDARTAETVLEQSGALFRELDDTGGLAWVAGTESCVRLLQGRLAEARELAQSVLLLADSAGEGWSSGVLLAVDALAAAELGDTATSRVQARRATARLGEQRGVWGQALALVTTAAAERVTGDVEAAAEHLEQAARLAEQGPFPYVGVLALVLSGGTCLDRGDLDGAQDAADRVAALVEGADLGPSAAVLAAALRAQVLHARRCPAEALAELAPVLRAGSPDAGLLFPRRQALAEEAGLLLALGHVEQAVAAARRAVAEPAEDLRSEVAALHALGTALAAAGVEGEARDLLERSRERGVSGRAAPAARRPGS